MTATKKDDFAETLLAAIEKRIAELQTWLRDCQSEIEERATESSIATLIWVRRLIRETRDEGV